MNSEKMIFSLEFGKNSATGKNKIQNEDTIGYYLPTESEKLDQRGQMFMVVDGSGGQEDGEYASKMVVETVIETYFEDLWENDVKQMLIKALRKANQVIFDANIEKATKGYFSCSIMCAVIHENTIYLAGIGNCAAYLFSNDQLEELSETDDTTKGKSPPYSDIHGEMDSDDKSQFLGYYENIQIEVMQRQIQLKDAILICTDSINQTVPKDDVRLIMSTSAPVQSCETVVDQALKKNPDEDATAIMMKVKGIKRLTVKDEDVPLKSSTETKDPQKREIVIKGVRYQSKVENGEVANDNSADDFSNDREIRPSGLKRIKTKPPTKDSDNSFSRYLNFAIVIAIIAVILFLIFKYIPDYWKSLTTTKVQQIKAIPDTVDSIAQSDSTTTYQPTDSVTSPIVEDATEAAEDTTTKITAEPEPPEIPARISLDVAMVNGSLKQISLSDLVNQIKSISSTNRISTVTSNYRFSESKILWRRTGDDEVTSAIQDRISQYETLFFKFFNIQPDVIPLDFTIVIGQDFKLPQVQDRYLSPEGKRENVYLEVLNGYKISGMARMLSNQLHNQEFQNKKLEIVDYRNADHSNYPKSFIKCDSTLTETAEKLISIFGLPELIVNEPLFEIKILIGADINL